MAANPFCRGVHGDIGSPLYRAEKITSAGEGVVHDYADALPSSHLYNRLIIRHIESRISEVFEEDDLGPFVNEFLHILGLVGSGDADIDTEVAKGDGKHSERAAVEERLSHNIVSRAADIGDAEENCRLP